MRLHENPHINFFLKLLYAVLLSLAGFFIMRYLLRWIWPLFVVMLLSAAIIKPVDYLSRSRVLPRSVLSGIFTMLILALSGLSIYLLTSFAIYQSRKIVAILPQFMEYITAQLAFFEASVDKLLTSAFPALEDIQLISLEGFFSQMSLPQIDMMSIVSKLSSAAVSVPGILFTLVFIFVGTYFLTSERQKILDFCYKQIPPGMASGLTRLRIFLSSSVFKWIKAQLILMSITFVELTLAFTMLGMPYIVLLAAGISVIDAFPILGVGTILIPWAFFAAVGGNLPLAGALLLTYVLVLAVRNALEPKIVGEKLGLHPFITLLCLYFGFRLSGFLGMFMLPIFVLSLIKLQEWGYVKLWK